MSRTSWGIPHVIRDRGTGVCGGRSIGFGEHRFVAHRCQLGSVRPHVKRVCRRCRRGIGGHLRVVQLARAGLPGAQRPGGAVPSAICESHERRRVRVRPDRGRERRTAADRRARRARGDQRTQPGADDRAAAGRQRGVGGFGGGAGPAPAATAGLAGGSAPGRTGGTVATAVAPASPVPSALVPAGTPAAAVQAVAPTGSAALAPASTPGAAVLVESEVPPVTAGGPASAITPVRAAVEAEAPAFSPAAALPAVSLAGTPAAAAPAVAPPAAAGPAGTPNEQPAGTPASAARAE